jgi:hypothetical protein
VGHRHKTQNVETPDLNSFARKLVTINKGKNGKMRQIPLNSIALAVFQELFGRSTGQGPVFVNIHGELLKGYKHWFEPAVRQGIEGFTWYCPPAHLRQSPIRGWS